MFRDRLKGATVTAAPELLPSTLNCTLVVLVDTVVETVIVPETVAPVSGDVIEIVGAEAVVLLTVILTAALVVACAAASLATAVSECPPFASVAVFKERLNGALVITGPALLPSTLNCTLVVLEETLVKTVTVPETVAPARGDVMETVGAEEELLTLIATAALVVFCPDDPKAMPLSEWLPSDNFVVSSE